jgi:hypothetical protein
MDSPFGPAPRYFGGAPMPRSLRRPVLPFIAANTAVWLVMTAILVVVPDTLARWMSLEIARVVGWAVACGVWVVAVERSWQDRAGPFTRFAVQIVLWVSAAVVAIWVSEHAQWN